MCLGRAVASTSSQAPSVSFLALSTPTLLPQARMCTCERQAACARLPRACMVSWARFHHAKHRRQHRRRHCHPRPPLLRLCLAATHAREPRARMPRRSTVTTSECWAANATAAAPRTRTCPLIQFCLSPIRRAARARRGTRQPARAK